MACDINHEANPIYLMTYRVGWGRDEKPLMVAATGTDRSALYQDAEDMEIDDPGCIHEILEIDRKAGTVKDITRHILDCIEEALRHAVTQKAHNASFARPSGY